jgi:cytochrome oxidase Cu insertion factor (SCO1/SenC/PrrC family)
MRPLLLVAVLIVLDCLCAGQTAATHRSDGDRATMARASADEAPLPGDLEWRDRNGKVMRLAEFSGKPLILNFGASRGLSWSRFPDKGSK